MLNTKRILSKCMGKSRENIKMECLKCGKDISISQYNKNDGKCNDCVKQSIMRQGFEMNKK